MQDTGQTALQDANTTPRSLVVPGKQGPADDNYHYYIVFF